MTPHETLNGHAHFLIAIIIHCLYSVVGDNTPIEKSWKVATNIVDLKSTLALAMLVVRNLTNS